MTRSRSKLVAGSIALLVLTFVVVAYSLDDRAAPHTRLTLGSLNVWSYQKVVRIESSSPAITVAGHVNATIQPPATITLHNGVKIEYRSPGNVVIDGQSVPPDAINLLIDELDVKINQYIRTFR